MEKIQMRYGPNYVYILCFTCPDCQKLLVRHSYHASPQTEAELRPHMYRVEHACGFNGALAGSEIIHFVELDFTEWATTAAV